MSLNTFLSIFETLEAAQQELNLLKEEKIAFRAKLVEKTLGMFLGTVSVQELQEYHIYDRDTDILILAYQQEIDHLTHLLTQDSN